MSALDYLPCDADNHYYEAEDCFTRHIEKRFRERTLRLVVQPDGTKKPMVDGREYTYLPNPFLHFGRPGQMRDMMEGVKTGSIDPENVTERFPENMDAGARLRLLDAQGLEKIFLFPSLAITTQPILWHDVELLVASMRAFNRWLDEDWGFARAGRMFSAPCIWLHDVAAAVRGLEWVIAPGAGIVGWT